MFKAFCSAFAVLILSACGASTSSTLAAKLVERTWVEGEVSPQALVYCNQESLYPNFYTVSGTANFEYREVKTAGDTIGLGPIEAETKPIRHAQFEVVDALGNQIQCGETSSTGTFTFKVPKSGSAYILKVYSRSQNLFNKANVFKAPETNELYFISANFRANKNQSDLSLIAKADETHDVIAGAFNILDQIHRSFDRLKALIVDSDIENFVDILEISTADIYWEKGFNPGFYVGVESGLSFLSRKNNVIKIFINGGLNGDVNFTDTDHFDNSIILHEYFHFLETKISLTHSPGGAHNGNQLLDPRLAWSEGAAQFYQAAIRNQPTVLDTFGNSDGETDFLIKLSVESGTNDLPQIEGEGEYREFSVARFLWDTIDSVDEEEQAPETDFDLLENRFTDFWKAFASKGENLIGFNSGDYHFISLGALLDAMNANSSGQELENSSAWIDLMNHEKLLHPGNGTGQGFREGYAYQYDLAGGENLSFSYEPSFGLGQGTDPLDYFPVAHIKYHSLNLTETSVFRLENASTATMQAFIYTSEQYPSFARENANVLQQGQSITLPPGKYLVGVHVIEVTNPSTPESLDYSFGSN